MLTTVAGVCALRKLRLAWEEDAGDVFPEAVKTELFVLYDVCKQLGLNIFQTNDVLGDDASEVIRQHLDTHMMPTDTAYQLIEFAPETVA